MAELLALSGVPADVLPDLNEASVQIRQMVSLTEPDVLLEDGQPVGLPGWDLDIIWTPGHSPGHICLYSDSRKLLLSGDHVLPRITPNISVQRGAPPDPLGDYLASLARTRDLDVDEVLPAHEWRFDDLRARTAELRRHHDHRLEEVVTAIREGYTTAWEITPRMTWSRPWDDVDKFTRRAAIGEAMAMRVPA